MIVFRHLRGRWSLTLAKGFRRTRRAKPTMLLIRPPAPDRMHEFWPAYDDPIQLRLHCPRWERRRPPARPAQRGRPEHRGALMKRDGLMHCVTPARGRYDLLELEPSGNKDPSRRYGSRRHRRPLASAAAHHQVRHGAAWIWPF